MEEILLPDTHAHLDAAELADDLHAALERARQSGVGPILAVGSDLETSVRAVEIAQMYDNVFAAVGVHPHEAGRFAEEKERVHALLDVEKVIAVGEIGLDYHRDRVSPDIQRAAFREQLGWARERGIPASVHNRDADSDVLLAIEESGAAAILHCFSSDWETASSALKLGCAISFAGNVTFPKSAALRDVAARVPLERLLVESDAPVLAPQPRRGRRNEPQYVVMTAETLAEKRRLSFDALAQAIARNAGAILGWGQA